MNKQEIQRAKEHFKRELDEEMKHYTMYNDYTQKKIEDHKILWSYILELEKKVRKENAENERKQKRNDMQQLYKE